MKCIIITICSLLLTSLSYAQATSFESELNALFEGVFPADAPGGSILVMKGDETRYMRSFGLADLKTKEKITEHTVFNTGSISKTFVSNGILILKEDRLLSLEDDLYQYFDDFDNESLARKVKLKHLLSHTSGLPDIRDVSNNKKFFLTAKDKENFNPIKRADKLNFEPGAQFQYSNPAFNGLALIIEQITGMPWQRYIENEIFKPAGMKSSKITDGSYPDSEVAHAYVYEDGEYQEYDYGECPTFAASGNGGVWCSTLDLAKYEHAIREHLFLSKEMIEKSRTIYHPQNWSDTANPFLGYGWFIEDKDAFRVKRVYHTGSQGGFRAFYIAIPEKEITYVALFNRPIAEYASFMEEGVMIMQQNNWLD